MKKTIAMLLVVLMAVGALVGCTATTPAAATSTEAPAEATAEATAAPTESVDLSETGTLKLAWVAGIGTNSIFECPYTDIKCL
ncbi:MAG: hypothetical protein ABFC56_10615 [Clostridiaceae bacterium]